MLMTSLREDLDAAYKAAYSLADTHEEREAIRSTFRKLFASAKQSRRSGVRIPVPDPLGILTDTTKGSPIELYDPMKDREQPKKPKGEWLCDKLDDDEITDFARIVCGDDPADNCVEAVYGYSLQRKDGEINDAELNRSITRTLKHHGIVPTGDYATMLKMRSPCMVDEIMKICNYDPECLDRYQILAETLDDPFAFRREMKNLQEVLP